MLKPEAVNEAATHQAERILIIEDEELIRELIAQSLRQEGYEVLTACNGSTGLELALQLIERDSNIVLIDLLILDLALPDIEGLSVCQYLREKGCNVPILIISARCSENDRVLGLETGADDYLPKPFGMRELIARCRALTRRWELKRQPANPKLRFRDIVLDLCESIVIVRGEEVYLSPRELQLLRFFMEHPRQMWPREQLVQEIWGNNVTGDSKTLEVHIRWLREKLELDPGRPEYIVTLRGFGYRFG